MVLEFSLGTFCPEKQDYLFRFSVAPVNFLLEQVKKSCAIEGDVTRNELERRFLAQHSASMLKHINVVTIRDNVATMLQHCVALKIVVANRTNVSCM